MSATGVLNQQAVADNAGTIAEDTHDSVPPVATAPSNYGRIKAPPVSSAMGKREGMSSTELSKMCFSPDQAETSSAAAAELVPSQASPAVYVCKDSPSTTASSSGNSVQQHEQAPAVVAVVKNSVSPTSAAASTPTAGSPNAESIPSAPVTASTKSAINARVLRRTTSRQGREKQRWETDYKHNHLYRLTTGAVPIMQDGKILFVSSSRKESWILPKGGWDNDESLEESAIREVYEEAGVVGSLGPRLTDVCYETRKAKKRRLEREEMLQQHRREKNEAEFPRSRDSFHSDYDSTVPNKMNTTTNSLNEPISVTDNAAAPQALKYEGNETHSEMKPVVSDAHTTVVGVAAKLRAATDAEGSVGTAESTASTVVTGFDDAGSVASAASGTSDGTAQNTHVRLALFVMYVSEALNEWPESGRARKVVDIDEAIATMESQNRPEFRAALMEVKQRGLHTVSVRKEGTVQGSNQKGNEDIEMATAETTKDGIESSSADGKI